MPHAQSKIVRMDTGLAQHVFVVVEQQVDHQFHHLARGEVLAGGLVGGLCEATDQFLEDGAHVGVGDTSRV